MAKLSDEQIDEEATKKAEAAAKQAVADAENKRQRQEEAAALAAVNAENARKQAVVEADNAKAAAVQQAKDEAAKRERVLENLHALQKQTEQATIEKEQRIAREKKAEQEMAETKRINDKAHRLAINTEVFNKIKYFRDFTSVSLVYGKPHAGFNASAAGIPKAFKRSFK